MQCLSCGHHNLQSAKFCEQCGAALRRRCAACGSELAAAAKFCSECGADAQVDALARAPAAGQQPAAPRDATTPAPGADRRQASVLFADICGYTALCARSDAEQIQRMLGRFFDAMDKVVEGHGGYVFDRAGDAVMAVFGAPVAHGNDAQRALRAALAMHTAAATVADCDGAPVRLHIGMASGEVVAAAIGGGIQPKYSVTGAAVNLAARLDGLAAPGETLISDTLYQEVSDTVDALAVGEHALKGLAVPVAVWRVLGLRESRGERRPLVGRQAELRQLVSALDTARDTGIGATLFVRGDAGIGKSRLIEEFRARAREQGFDTALGHVLDFGVGKGQDTIATLLKALLGIDALADERARSAGLLSAVERELLAEDEVLFINEWLDLPQPAELAARYEAMDNATRQRRAGEALAAVLRRVAALRPLLVLVEDIHWASPELLRHLAAIARAAAQAPVVLLLSSRIEGDPIDKAWRASIQGCSLMSLDLAPLRAHEAQLLAGGLVDATSPFVVQCIERAEGNPLFLEQLLRTVRGGDPPGLAPAVPPTIRSLVLERMDRLGAADRATLQTAAVLGKRFSLSSLRGVDGQPLANVDALVAADLVRPDASDFLFAHALIQEAVYVSTLKSRRGELHRTAARWFGDGDPVLQAEHLDRADDADAAAAYLRAATVEAARLRFEAAMRLAERGTVLATQMPQADAATGCALALLCGEVLHEVGRSADSIAAFESALGLAVEDVQRCRAWMGVAAGHRVTGDFAAAMDALAQAEQIASRLGLTIELSRIHHTRGNLFFAQGRIDECDAQHVIALRFAEECGDTESQARAQSGLGDARYAQGRMHSALGHFRRCVALSEGQIRIAGPNRCMIGHCLWYENQLPAAIAEAQAARDDGLRGGVISVQVFAQVSLTQLLTEAGRYDESDAACEQALRLARQAGSRRYESLALSYVAESQLRRGQPAQARDTLRQALALAQQTGLGFVGAALYGLLARAAGDAAERAQCLADGAALLRQTGLVHNHLWFYRDAIESTLAVGEWQAALDHASALEQAFQVEPLPWVALVVERARAIVAAALFQPDAIARLRQVHASAVAVGLGSALQGIDAALGQA